jgi:hypothetical protein
VIVFFLSARRKQAQTTHNSICFLPFYRLDLIDEQEECSSLITLTAAQYNNKSNDEKLAYRQSQERCGLNIGFDKTFAYCMDMGYRQGWDIEYTNKTTTVNPDYQPIGKPSLILPVYPSPLPAEIQYEGDMHWFKTNYAIGWDNGCAEGTAEGRIEGKIAGKDARLKGDDYHFANVNGYRRGYNDALLNLTAQHDVVARNRRQLRASASDGGSVERRLREEYETSYAEGYAEASMQAEQHERELEESHHHGVERHLAARKTCTQACIKYHNDATLNTNQWNSCKLIVKACRSSRRRRSLQEEGDPEFEWNHVDTLPIDGAQGGTDFKTLLAHLVTQNCDIANCKFEVWKMCPIAGGTPTPAPALP